MNEWQKLATVESSTYGRLWVFEAATYLAPCDRVPDVKTDAVLSRNRPFVYLAPGGDCWQQSGAKRLAVAHQATR